MKRCIILFALAYLYSCSHPHYPNPHVVIETNYGDIEVELYPDKAPITANAFLSYIDSGYYDNSFFYRVVKADDQPTSFNTGIIQGGVWQSNKVKVPGIPHESTARSGLSHTDGTISLARTTPGSASTEFFICIGDQSPLDSERRGSPDGLGFAAFGKVWKGMDVVRKIQDQPSNGESFINKINIADIRRL